MAGRDFSDADREGSQPVAIVCEAAARRFWPGREAVGQSLLLHALDAPPTRIMVVGVARDLNFGGPANPRLDVYMPLGFCSTTPNSFIGSTVKLLRATSFYADETLLTSTFRRWLPS